MTTPKPPEGLGDRSRKLWRRVLDEYELSEPEIELLRLALVARDEADEAREILKRDGLTVVDRYGSPKQHPAVDVANRARAFYARAVAQLGVKEAEGAQRTLWSRGARPGPRERVATRRR